MSRMRRMRAKAEGPYVEVLQRAVGPGSLRIVAVDLPPSIVAGLLRAGHRVADVRERPRRRDRRGGSGWLKASLDALPLATASADAVVVGPSASLDAADVGPEVRRVVRTGGAIVSQQYLCEGAGGRILALLVGRPIPARSALTRALLSAGFAEIGQAELRPALGARRAWPAVLTWGKRPRRPWEGEAPRSR